MVRKLRSRRGEVRVILKTCLPLMNVQVGQLASRLVVQWKQVVMEYQPPDLEQDFQPPEVYTQPMESKLEVKEEDREGQLSVLERTGLSSQVKTEDEEEEENGEDGIKTDDNAPAHDISQGQELELPEYWEHPPMEGDLDEYDNFALAADPENWASRHEPSFQQEEEEEELPTPTKYSPLSKSSGGSRKQKPPPSLSSKTPPPSSRPESGADRRLTALRTAPRTPVTPLPDYAHMLSPQLRAELVRFGLKAVPRRKAAQLLHHIYEKTHPLVPCTPRPGSPSLSSRHRSLAKVTARRISSTVARDSKKSKEIRQKSPVHQSLAEGLFLLPNLFVAEEEDEDEEEKSQASSQGSQSSQSSQLGPEEESIWQGQEDDIWQSQEGGDVEDEVPASLHQRLSAFIRSRPSLHQQVLEYEPLWLKAFHEDVKEEGIKCNLGQVMDYLDLRCICFRTETSQKRNKKKSPKKKKSPVKKRTPKKKSRNASQAGPSISPVKRARTKATVSKGKKS